jgi:hypothetical protein
MPVVFVAALVLKGSLAVALISLALTPFAVLAIHGQSRFVRRVFFNDRPDEPQGETGEKK